MNDYLTIQLNAMQAIPCSCHIFVKKKLFQLGGSGGGGRGQIKNNLGSFLGF